MSARRRHRGTAEGADAAVARRAKERQEAPRAKAAPRMTLRAWAALSHAHTRVNDLKRAPRCSKAGRRDPRRVLRALEVVEEVITGLTTHVVDVARRTILAGQNQMSRRH